ncbi:MAG: hypothetical protein PUC65_12615 [Clostridiales bacterium]|nr:hypothetical protein [Clostridiales bacterium]
MKKYNIMSICCALLCMLSSSIGLFYSFGGSRYVVNNIYGEEIEIYGDGIYANDTLLKVGGTRGADLTVLLIGALLVGLALWKTKKRSIFYIQAGLLVSLFYNTSCLILGNTFNQLFLVYLVQFSLLFFTLFFLVNDLMKREDLQQLQELKSTGTAVFLMIAGCSVLIWLTIIIPALINKVPIETIDIYTTEPTFVFDLGLILPFYWICGIQILKKKVNGYKMAAILLTFLCIIGISVIFQTIIQIDLGITIEAGQLVGMVASFVILAIISVVQLIKIIKKMNQCDIK